ncbi:MTW1 (YAL034W-A) [Zygosaccharomyces parabailii]|uniref:ZYBA0S07-04896g1_1 n=1 Tax=Zygosaccharomyces bailii (strain CLIB 213 / ATCC 58445 / CBS 680 / BCRC 21525 / NBRC 1098 / NCYC 1416 / NRRL Y-2227) TaxID=1333698 RepID=A0A8J2XC95_ZYGB2|nr:MTW1 (YAL034W-A) [Zygosaccharomyces parabailii]CDF90604.1 ZYBA0S07-04896g1_1 [Zygosaccharomyces bailii CLIB 213]
MAAPTMKSTSILTEHLQYPAISLVDDIINAVNEVMYKCTAAMEKYLLERSKGAGKDYTEEIRVGIAKLETLLEHSVDKNFDKLELYVLRNVLRIPQELLDANVFRLSYQRDLLIPSDAQKSSSISQLEEKGRQIEQSLQRNYELRRRLETGNALKQRIMKFKTLVRQMLECEDSPQSQELVRVLAPIDDSLKLVTAQLRQLYVDSEEQASMEKVLQVHSKFQTHRSCDRRSMYIDTETKRILGPQKKENEAQQAEEGDFNIKIESPDLTMLQGLLES